MSQSENGGSNGTGGAGGADDSTVREPTASNSSMFYKGEDYFAQVAILSASVIQFCAQRHRDPVLILTALKAAASMYESGLSGEAIRITLSQMFAAGAASPNEDGTSEPPKRPPTSSNRKH